MGNENKAVRPPQPGPRVAVPFDRRHRDIGSWAFEHRVGLCCMIIAYLALGIAFVSIKIATIPESPSAMYLDLSEMMAELPMQPEEQEQEQARSDDFSNVQNKISDENGGRESVGARASASAGASSSRSMSEFMEGLDAEAAAVAGRVKASRDAYERGGREIQDMIDKHKAQREAKDDEKPSGVKQKGNVLVSYSLPGRVDVYLHVPAYQCDGGGEVVVNITVNRNGKVVSSSLRESTTQETCINETALMAARNSTFNVDGTASDRQNGTITYVFVPQ